MEPPSLPCAFASLQHILASVMRHAELVQLLDDHLVALVPQAQQPCQLARAIPHRPIHIIAQNMNVDAFRDGADLDARNDRDPQPFARLQRFRDAVRPYRDR